MIKKFQVAFVGALMPISVLCSSGDMGFPGLIYYRLHALFYLKGQAMHL